MSVDTLVKGKVVRFEAARGYGFIAPLDGGEDVFVHANDLKSGNGVPVSCGTTVEFRLIEGERGLKAYDVSILDEPRAAVASRSLTPAAGEAGDDTCDVLSTAAFMAETTELIIASVPALTGAQISDLRVALCRMATAHGWVE